MASAVQAAGSVTADLTLNTAEWLFLGPLYIGTPLQGEPAYILYDSSIGYTTVTSATCGDLCINNYYDSSNSSTYTSLSSSPSTLLFPNSPVFRGDSLIAEEVSDQVCFSNDETACVADFDFYSVVQENIDYLDSDVSGFVGFGPSESGMPNYIESLKEAGIIDSQVVTFNLSADESV